MPREFVERRQFSRVYLKAYGYNIDCEVICVNKHIRKASLIDISRGGARLKLTQVDNRFGVGDTLHFSLPTKAVRELQSIDSVVSVEERTGNSGLEFVSNRLQTVVRELIKR